MPSASNKVLFVFEGRRTEPQIAESLEKEFLSENHSYIKSIFGAEIYQLYNKLKVDEDLDTFMLLKERDPVSLNDFKRDDFSEIYLFFDYDGHATKADDKKMAEMLDCFKEETGKGKLYISYPMVEALKHIVTHDGFKDMVVSATEKGYKEKVDKEAMNSLKDLRKYNLEIWRKVIETHLKKMKFIVDDRFELPQRLIEQKDVFSKQRSKFINPNSKISVLSAFPAFIHDYFGNQKTIEMLSSIDETKV